MKTTKVQKRAAYLNGRTKTLPFTTANLVNRIAGTSSFSVSDDISWFTPWGMVVGIILSGGAGTGIHFLGMGWMHAYMLASLFALVNIVDSVRLMVANKHGVTQGKLLYKPVKNITRSPNTAATIHGLTQAEMTPQTKRAVEKTIQETWDALIQHKEVENVCEELTSLKAQGGWQEHNEQTLANVRTQKQALTVYIREHCDLLEKTHTEQKKLAAQAQADRLTEKAQRQLQAITSGLAKTPQLQLSREGADALTAQLDAAGVVKEILQ